MILRNTLETSDVTGGGPELFLYQSGYLTIKSCVGNVYHLGFPNEEVKQALYECVLPALTMRQEADTQSLQAQLYQYLEYKELDKAMKALKALVADVPYSNKKLVPQYLENVTAPSQYDLLEMVKISGFIDRQKGLGRPTKKDGRELSRFTDDMYSYSDTDFDFDEDFLEDE